VRSAEALLNDPATQDVLVRGNMQRYLNQQNDWTSKAAEALAESEAAERSARNAEYLKLQREKQEREDQIAAEQREQARINQARVVAVSSVTASTWGANQPGFTWPEIEALLAADPRNPGYRNLQAAALGQLGEYDRAIGVYEQLLADYPAQPKAWMSLGHALKTVGRQGDSVAAYRRCLDLLPSHKHPEFWEATKQVRHALSRDTVHGNGCSLHVDGFDLGRDVDQSDHEFSI
jgi:tetratricopeptide (TPR) repeat protein